ncbi:hypothetical protein, partial [Mesorhizobium sp. M4B.F.Ca.ET.215.01.1.1]|uniref:hypothetical protein n=1 Tax=Mesorhizobium sp. M4B.F.Ca.ET.215.01.1.1 TaxID=2563956 RepID=UPI001AED9935
SAASGRTEPWDSSADGPATLARPAFAETGFIANAYTKALWAAVLPKEISIRSASCENVQEVFFCHARFSFL